MRGGFFLNVLSNCHGQVLLTQITMLSSVMSLVLLGFLTNGSEKLAIDRAQAQLRNKVFLTELEQNIKYNLQDTAAWELTKSSNGSYLCFSGAPCTPVAPTELVLKDAGDQILIDNAPSSGFSLWGQSCSGFSLDDNSSDCVFRYEVWVSSFCPSGVVPCGQRKHRVSVRLLVSRGKGLNINSENYGFEIIK